MPVRTGKDKEGCYAQWGGAGKKYYYPCNNEKAQGKAKEKAFIQGYAATGGEEESERVSGIPIGIIRKSHFQL